MLSMEPSISLQYGFYATATIGPTCYALIHAFIMELPRSLQSFEAEQLLRRMFFASIMQYSLRLRFESDGMLIVY
jgi:hypothetical protein